MNDQVLQLLVSLGEVAALVGLCALLFGRRDTPIAGPQAAASCLARDIPGFRAARSALSTDAKAALVEDARDGQVYLLVARGDGIVARKLVRGLLRGVVRTGDRLTLSLDDFTLGGAQLQLGDAPYWEARLRGLAR
jgi:hypothetical protein